MGVEDMEFPGVLKIRMYKFYGVIKKEVKSTEVIKKK